MVEPAVLLSVACASFGGIAIAAATALRGWAGWLEIKRLKLTRQGEPHRSSSGPSSGVELANLKERVRRLEAIATGVDF